MSAVVCSDFSTSPRGLELKSAALTLMAVVLKTIDLDALAAELTRRADAMPGLFDDEPVVIDLWSVRESEQSLNFEALVGLLRAHCLRPVAARGGNAEQMSAALAAGLMEAPEGVRLPPPEPMIIERIVEKQLPPLPPLVLDRTLRSGQQVHACNRDLVVTALVSFGAEVTADGNIYIYAPMRGRAHAGIGGNREARIYCHHMEAQVLAIASTFLTTDVALPANVAGCAAMVRLAGDQLVVEPLG